MTKEKWQTLIRRWLIEELNKTICKSGAWRFYHIPTHKLADFIRLRGFKLNSESNAGSLRSASYMDGDNRSCFTLSCGQNTGVILFAN